MPPSPGPVVSDVTSSQPGMSHTNTLSSALSSSQTLGLDQASSSFLPTGRAPRSSLEPIMCWS